MDPTSNYLEINRTAWNHKTEIHIASDFYDHANFMKGKSSLKSIELALLGDLQGKTILHLQCHFGQDSISLQRLGAQVTAVDFSDKAIESARKFAQESQADVRFICCDIYDLPQHLSETFDIVFTSYGTIGWLPDLNRWANLISRFLKPHGSFIFVEFHPVVWMFDDDFTEVRYAYMNNGPIHETYTGTYADQGAPLTQEYVMWNHGISEVLSPLLAHGLEIQSFHEFDYSPYPCFRQTIEFEPGKYRIPSMQHHLPMVYALKAIKR